MNTLGGGTTHAVMGMRVWSHLVRPIASLGRDFPICLVDQMGDYFDLSGLVRRSLPNPRAWQLFDEDGTRNEVFRTTYEDFLAINPLPHEVPLDRLRALGVHLQSQSPQPALQWIERLRQAGSPYILYEPWDQFCLPENYDEFMELARQCDAVSPNFSEARQLTGLERAGSDRRAPAGQRHPAAGAAHGRRRQPDRHPERGAAARPGCAGRPGDRCDRGWQCLLRGLDHRHGGDG
jgi:sugar/nucleoside kinase (ribokinase family)